MRHLMPLVFIFCAFFPSGWPKKASSKAFYFLDLKFDRNPVYFNEFKGEINPGGASLEMEIGIEKELGHELSAQTTLAQWNKASKTYRNLLLFDVNVCEQLEKGNNKLNLVSLWISSFWKYGTLPKKCPLKAGTYYWHGLKLDKDNLPGFILNGKYRMTLNIYMKKGNLRDPVGNFSFNAQIK